MKSVANASKFERLGRIFNADGRYDWMVSHASNPTPVHLAGDTFRIFFSTRDERKRSSVGFVDYDVVARRIESVSTKPLIVPGDAGYFDDSGISCACVTNNDGRYLFYYVGWNLAVAVPFRNSIGLAVGDTLNRFEKHSRAPVLDRSVHDPLSVSYPWVLRDGDKWRMWYGTHVAWRTERHEMIHVLAHALSDDGWNWRPTGHIVLPQSEEEYAFSRPCVLRENGRYKMWFSVRGDRYRIGYAESADGLVWERDATSIGGSGQGWDSDSSSYAAVFDHAGKRYAVYCGNDYGATGFGLATLT